MPPPILPKYPLPLDLIAEYDLATTVLSQAYKSLSKSCPFSPPLMFKSAVCQFHCPGMFWTIVFTCRPVLRVLMASWKMTFWQCFHPFIPLHIPISLHPAVLLITMGLYWDGICQGA
jgi:hypothetical protein